MPFALAASNSFLGSVIVAIVSILGTFFLLGTAGAFFALLRGDECFVFALGPGTVFLQRPRASRFHPAA